MWSDRLILHQEVIFFAKLYEKNDFYDLKIITLSLGEGLSINMAVFDLDNETIMKTIATNQFFENGQVSHEM